MVRKPSAENPGTKRRSFMFGEKTVVSREER
jgi:hypothetical protein